MADSGKVRWREQVKEVHESVAKLEARAIRRRYSRRDELHRWKELAGGGAEEGKKDMVSGIA